MAKGKMKVQSDKEVIAKMLSDVMGEYYPAHKITEYEKQRIDGLAWVAFPKKANGLIVFSLAPVPLIKALMGGGVRFQVAQAGPLVRGMLIPAAGSFSR